MKNDQVSDLLNSYIMARTSQQLYHGKNKLTAISWQEQVNSYIMARTSQQLYHGKNKLNFDEIMMMFALY